MKVLVCVLQTSALQEQVASQRHSPCISQSQRLSVPDVAAQPHDASVISVEISYMVLKVAKNVGIMKITFFRSGPDCCQ